ncbi:hypothetical protein [Mesorhizobium sp.]|uniref:hypothetical protein n=1 Tax=Mesorhizobium sp. TaxID=1871066 RepID=UPI0025F2F864|nr:hypothetical protein [Mesorhizobium sp.]
MRRPCLKDGDFAGILLTAVVLALAVLALLFYPPRGENFGFGPDWQCARMERGDPICVRLINKDTQSSR